MPSPQHLTWLVPANHIETSEGRSVHVFEFQHQPNNQVLSDWARHFRQQYCSDSQIDSLRDGTPHSRAEYLRLIKFPDSRSAPGPSIRAGDFAEVLVADYLEFTKGYWLPRTRYDNKTVRNESTKGTDIIGFKILKPGQNDPQDTLALFEAKAQLTGGLPTKRLQVAVTDSGKDHLRRAESLNAIKQRHLDVGKLDEVKRVERFQNPDDRPYREDYGAVAVMSDNVFDHAEIRSTSTADHPNPAALTLIVIRGSDLMPLVHELYRRAADEA